MSTPAIASTTAPAAGTTSTPASSRSLDVDSSTFLKLMVANLQHQDPMSPQDSSQYVQQLSQMTMVEQITNLAKTSADAVSGQKRSDAVALLGRSVTWSDPNGAHTGKVTDIDLSGDAPAIKVGTTTLQLADVTAVS